MASVENYIPGVSGGGGGGGGGVGGVGGVGGTPGPFFLPTKYQITNPTTTIATIIQRRVIILIINNLRPYILFSPLINSLSTPLEV